MVQTSIPDIIGPAIATDDPDTLAHKRICDCQQIANACKYCRFLGPSRIIQCALETVFEQTNTFTLCLYASLCRLVSLYESRCQFFTDHRGTAREQFTGILLLFV